MSDNIRTALADAVRRYLEMAGQVREIEARMKDLRAEIQEMADALLDGGTGTIETPHGKVLVVEQRVYAVADERLVPHEVLKLALDSKAVEAWTKLHGDLPPGVKMNTRRTLSVRR